ncbi:MAG: YnbE family lipoprotein [Novosphingobium sp.]
MQGFSNQGRPSGLRSNAVAVLVGGALAMGGCVSVNAPDKPIVIELNINIKQEVIYRLAADAGATIDKNAGIF